MIFIDKTGKEPADFILWKEHHAEKLQALYTNPSIKGTQVWKYLDQHKEIYDKGKLKSTKQVRFCFFGLFNSINL